ncbi:MAG: hypothetical protein ACRDR6_18620 [Pseudonocardiaceae bacterium]
MVVVYSMDRLARNLDDRRRAVRELTAKGRACPVYQGAAHFHW